MNESLEGKEKDKQGFRNEMFQGYVIGVADDSNGILWCSQQNVSVGQLTKIVANYLGSHPEIPHKERHAIVVDILKKSFLYYN